MSFKVFVTRHLTPNAEKKLNAFCAAEYWQEEPLLAVDNLIAGLKGNSLKKQVK